MCSAKKENERFLLSPQPEYDGIKKYAIPHSSVQATCAILAKWFNDIIEDRRIPPTEDGVIIFSVYYMDFLRVTGFRELNKYIRRQIKKYGFVLSKQRHDLVIKKKIT